VSSPHDSPAVKDWFRCLDSAWRCLPAEERDSQREEIQQHLEGLVAAKLAQGQLHEVAWEAAIRQFGDPTQLGRKMYQEWQQGRTGFRADMKAILFGCGLQAMRGAVDQCLYFFYSQNGSPPYPNPLFLWVIGMPATALIGFGIGCKYPHQAMKSALVWPFLWPLVLWAEAAILYSVGWMHLSTLEPLPRVLLDSFHYNSIVALSSCLAAYLASVTKRGWYRPSLADFKLTLPRRRPQLSQ